MFNLMHLDSAIKVDLIVRKNSEYRHAEFERRKSVEFAGISTWITSREDLILSKLVWARDTGSERGMRFFQPPWPSSFYGTRIVGRSLRSTVPKMSCAASK